LGIGAQCPRCQQELTEEHYKIVQAKYRDEIVELESKIETANRLMAEHKATAEKIHKEILVLEEKLTSLMQIKVKLGKLSTQRETLQNLKDEHEEAVSEVSELEALLDNDNFASERIAQIKNIERNLSDLRPHAEHYKSMKEKIEQYETDEVERRYLEAKGEADRKQEFERQKTHLEESNRKVQSSFSETEKKLKEKSKEHEEKKKIVTELKDLRDERTSLLQSQTEQNTVISVAKPQLESIQERVESLKRDLKRHETNLVQADILGVVRSWLEMAFIPSLQAIEKAVLLSLNQEFNRLFQRWFRDLIEVGELNGYIDEDFTPIVEQGGYELEVESLSGGEKTSVALAYRLALNTIVKQVTDTMKSNLLILDEPTDGFSREQLHKMRDILNDVNCDQIIMVSHEVELDNVADHIYRVRKEGNISTVIAPS